MSSYLVKFSFVLIVIESILSAESLLTFQEVIGKIKNHDSDDSNRSLQFDKCSTPINACFGDSDCLTCLLSIDQDILNVGPIPSGTTCAEVYGVVNSGMAASCDINSNVELKDVIDCVLLENFSIDCSAYDGTVTPTDVLPTESCLNYVFSCVQDPLCISCAYQIDLNMLRYYLNKAISNGMGSNVTCEAVVAVFKNAFTPTCIASYGYMIDGLVECLVDGVLGLDICPLVG
eukprot:CAMPEP_0171462208 /NCGR_PEP_ID=MMETSP0945-20130129/6339_1 /TAXON_ID=109269 /ORGANISM="Vaucheria litorea, Strain CCMP2940" /LENGTH=231 /DNA_ID=CAMNT_0011988691 /DNA_START=110 /DNA_END=805 /DNA_ORIENTATION=-